MASWMLSKPIAPAPAFDADDGDPPLDAAAERLRARLARLLLISGGFMMLGFIAVFAALVYKLGFAGAGRAVPPGVAVEAAIPLPAGSRLLAADLEGGRALLTTEAAGVTTLIAVELASGRVVGSYRLTPP